MSATTLLHEQDATGSGGWIKVRKINDKRTFQVSISDTAGVTIEASNDGVNAVPLRAGITASAGFEDDAPWQYVRATVDSIDAGTVTVIMGERE